MDKYYCEFCGVEKKLRKEEMKRTNPNAYCYCRPATPTLLHEISWKKEQKKYEGMFKNKSL